MEDATFGLILVFALAAGNAQRPFTATRTGGRL